MHQFCIKPARKPGLLQDFVKKIVVRGKKSQKLMRLSKTLWLRRLPCRKKSGTAIPAKPAREFFPGI